MVKLDKIKRLIPTKMYLQIMFYHHFRRFCNFKNPVTLNEKIQWLKLNDKKDRYIDLVDKIKVKEYIKRALGESYVIPTLGTWKDANEINLDDLPNKFVLKCNHDSHCVFICTDKSKFDIEEAKKILNTRLKYNAYWYGREWPYKYVEPQILAEKLLESEDGDLADYKLMCFNGVVDNIMVCKGRNFGRLRYYYFDRNWNLLKYQTVDELLPENFSLPKPKFLNEMIQLAEVLANNIPLVRVDFYEAENKAWFGEMTFYPSAGFDTDITYSADKIMGDRLNLF